MKWLVKSTGHTATLSADKLVKILSEQITKKQIADIDELTTYLLDFLYANKLFDHMKIQDYLHLGISIGYYYHMFLTMNEVEIQHEADSQDNDNTT